MDLQGRALFNLLRSGWLENPALKVQTWHVEDYRVLSIKELFNRLKKSGVTLDEKTFKHYADNCESPEELADCLWIDEDDLEGRDKLYLLAFELWRRLLPEKQTVSIFCDELDQLIELYDKGEANEEALQAALVGLEDILDRHVDEGGAPREGFLAIAPFSSHDLEGFIYDLIEDQLKNNNTLYASELFDGFYAYMPNPKKFDILKTQLLSDKDT